MRPRCRQASRGPGAGAGQASDDGPARRAAEAQATACHCRPPALPPALRPAHLRRRRPPRWSACRAAPARSPLHPAPPGRPGSLQVGWQGRRLSRAARYCGARHAGSWGVAGPQRPRRQGGSPHARAHPSWACARCRRTGRAQGGPSSRLRQGAGEGKAGAGESWRKSQGLLLCAGSQRLGCKSQAPGRSAPQRPPSCCPLTGLGVAQVQALHAAVIAIRIVHLRGKRQEGGQEQERSGC